jgi:hypothetical protein
LKIWKNYMKEKMYEADYQNFQNFVESLLKVRTAL